MDYQQTARAAVEYVRGGEQGALPAEVAALDTAGCEHVLAGARRYAATDATRVVEAMVDQLAAEYESDGRR